MTKVLTEDQVRDRDKILLGFDCLERYVKQGTGQITTFNQLGIAGINNRPDGWYIPDNKKILLFCLKQRAAKKTLVQRNVLMKSKRTVPY